MAGALEAKAAAHDALGYTLIDGLSPALHGDENGLNERTERQKRDESLRDGGGHRRRGARDEGRRREGAGFFLYYFSRVGVSLDRLWRYG